LLGNNIKSACRGRLLTAQLASSANIASCNYPSPAILNSLGQYMVNAPRRSWDHVQSQIHVQYMCVDHHLEKAVGAVLYS